MVVAAHYNVYFRNSRRKGSVFTFRSEFPLVFCTCLNPFPIGPHGS